MKKAKKHQYFILRVISGGAYFTLALEWFLLIGLVLPRIFDSSLGKIVFPKGEVPTVTTVSPAAQAPSGLVVGIAMVASLAMVLLVLYAVLLRYVPITNRAANKTIQVASQKALPLVLHKPVEDVSVKRRRTVTRRLRFWISVFFAGVPVAVLGLVNLHAQTLASLLVLALVTILALLSVVGSAMKAALQVYWRVAESDI